MPTSAPATVLIVDDTPESIEVMQGAFDGEGYTILVADNGFKALALAEERKPDVVLLDVMMPVLDGFEVCRRMRQSATISQVPILLVTALDDRDSRLRGLEAGADDFISKPVDRLELRARVKTITRLNRFQRLAQAQQRLAQSERLDAIARAASGIAHDFANYLMSISAGLFLIRERMHLGDPNIEVVDSLTATVSQAVSFVDQIKLLARGGTPGIERVDMGKIIADMQTMLRHLSRGATLEFALSDTPVVVMADAAQMRQVIINLVVNASEAVADNGKITVRLEPNGAKGHAVLEVSDNGCGMDAATLSQIFDPYFTTKGDVGGTGLGLSTVHGIVHTAGGCVDVRSQLGHGTTFLIYWPLAAS